MVNNDFYNLKWALQKNGFMKVNVFNEFQNNPEFLKILDNLILDIIKSGTNNIQEKFIGSPEIFDFHSSITELIVGKKFYENGFQIKLYPDKQQPTKSLPDFYAIDSKYEYEVEVKRIIQDDSLDKLTNYLEYQKYKNYFIDITIFLSNELTKFLTSPKYKKRIKKIIGEGLNKFESEVKNINIDNIPIEINTKMGSYSIEKTKFPFNKNNIIYGFKPQNGEIPNKIKKDVIETAKKKHDLKIKNPKKTLLIFLIFEQITMMASKIEDILNHTLYDYKKGIFYTEPIVNNIGAVIGKCKNRYFVKINPNSKDIITNPNFEDNLNFLK